MSLYLLPSFIFGICIPDSSNWDSVINSALPNIALLRSSSDYLLVSDLTDPPSIHLNSKYLPNQAEAVLTAGTPFTLRCTGASSVHWSSSAFRLLYHGRMIDPIDVQMADPRHTGTYRCGYTNQSLEHLSTWIHLYVKGNIRWSHSMNLEPTYKKLTGLLLPLSQIRLTPPLCLSPLAVAPMWRKVRTSYTGVCWLTHQSLTSPSNLRTTSKEVGSIYPSAWTWRLTRSTEPWSRMCSAHLVGNMSVQDGRTDTISNPDLSTCLWPPVRLVTLSFDLCVFWPFCLLVCLWL